MAERGPLTRAELREQLDHHVGMACAYANGTRSWTNLAHDLTQGHEDAPERRAKLEAVMDASSAQTHSAAAQALAARLSVEER